jgi:hypothetical protein
LKTTNDLGEVSGNVDWRGILQIRPHDLYANRQTILRTPDLGYPA